MALTNAGGDAVERYAYSPYGEVLYFIDGPYNSGIDYDGDGDSGDADDALAWQAGFGTPTQSTQGHYGNDYTYTGRRHDSETGLYHFRGRYFAWKEGRFVNRDPIGYNGSKWNLYAGYFVPGWG